MTVSTTDLKYIGVRIDNFERYSREYAYIQQTGEVKTTLGSATVTGSGTNFTSALVGQYIRIGNNIRTIASVESTTSLTTDTVWSSTLADWAVFYCRESITEEFEDWIAECQSEAEDILKNYLGEADWVDSNNSELFKKMEGSVVITASSTTLTGTDTYFDSSWVGKKVMTDNEVIRTISTVTSRTVADVTVAFSSAENTSIWLDQSDRIKKALVYLTAYRMILIDDYDEDGYNTTQLNSIQYKKEKRKANNFYNMAMNILSEMGYDIAKR